MPDQPDEPPTVNYTRRDPSTMPKTPAGQAAAIEGMLAAHGMLPADKPKLADHNRRTAARHLTQTGSAMGKLQAQMLEVFDQFERDRRAEIIAAGGDPDEDRDPLDYVRDIAAGYAAEAADSLDDYLDRLADELTLDDVRALRVAGEAAVAITPRLIMEATGRGMKPDRIADEIGLTPSRVYQIIRDQRRTEAVQREQ